MKNVFVLIHDDVGQEARLQAALDLTRAFDGHLNCLDVAQLPVLIGDIYGFAAQDQIWDDREREAENRGRIEARLIREGVSWDWLDAVGDIAPTITALTDLADVIVLNRKLDKAKVPDMQGIAAAVMLGSHKPVLAVPDSSRGCNVTGNAMIAWDGSPEASNALRSSVGMLKLAKSVTVVAVENGAADLSASQAASYLSRYDVHCEVLPVDAQGKSIDAVLIAQCRSLKADYVVMGGYGQARLTEALFGGVTQKMLSDCPVPILLAH